MLRNQYEYRKKDIKVVRCKEIFRIYRKIEALISDCYESNDTRTLEKFIYNLKDATHGAESVLRQVRCEACLHPFCDECDFC